MYGEARVRLSTEVDTSPISNARNEFAGLRDTVRASESTFTSANRTFASTGRSLDKLSQSSRNVNNAFQNTADIGERVGDRLLNTTNSYDRLVELTDNLAVRNSSLGKSLNRVEGALLPVARAYDRIEERATPVQKTFELIQITNRNLTQTLNTTAKTVNNLGDALEKAGPAGELTAEALRAISDQLQDISWLVFAVGKLEDFRDLLNGTTSALRTMGNAISGGAGATLDFAQGANEARQRIGGLGEQLMALTGAMSMFGRGTVKSIGMAVSGLFDLKMIIDSVNMAGRAFVDTNRHIRGLYDSLRTISALGVDTTIVQIRDAVGLLGTGLIGNFQLTNNIIDVTISKFAQLEQSLQFVRTISAGAEMDIIQLGRRVQDFVDGPMGNAISSIETTTALYNTLSAGIGTQNLDEAFDFIEVAGKLATATGASLDTVSQALIFAGKTFDEEFGKVGALLKRTVDQGQLTLNSLVNNLGRVSATAQAVGADIENTFAVIAASSQKLGTDSNIAVNALLNSLLNIGDQGTKVLEKYGVSLDKSTIRNKGLVTALNEAYNAMGRNTAELRKVIPETLAFSAALATLQNNSKAAKDALTSFADASAEDIEELFEESQKTITERLSTIQNQFTSAIEKAGIAFKESGLFDNLIKPVEAFAEHMADLPEPVYEFVGTILAFNLAAQKVVGILGSLVKALFAVGSAIFWIVAPMRLGAIISGFRTFFVMNMQQGKMVEAVWKGLGGALDGLIVGNKSLTTNNMKLAASFGGAAEEAGKLAEENTVLGKIQRFLLRGHEKATLAKTLESAATKENTAAEIANNTAKTAGNTTQKVSTSLTVKDTIAKKLNTAATKANAFVQGMWTDIAENFKDLAKISGKLLAKTIPGLLNGIAGMIPTILSWGAAIGVVATAIALLMDYMKGREIKNFAENLGSLSEDGAVAQKTLRNLAKEFTKTGAVVEDAEGGYVGAMAKVLGVMKSIAMAASEGVKAVGAFIRYLGIAIATAGEQILQGFSNLWKRLTFQTVEDGKSWRRAFGDNLSTLEDETDAWSDRITDRIGQWFEDQQKAHSEKIMAPIREAVREIVKEHENWVEAMDETNYQLQFLQPQAMQTAIEEHKETIDVLERQLEAEKLLYAQNELSWDAYQARATAVIKQRQLTVDLIAAKEKLAEIDLLSLGDPEALKAYISGIEDFYRVQILALDREIEEKQNQLDEIKKATQGKDTDESKEIEAAIEVMKSRRKVFIRTEEQAKEYANTLGKIQRGQVKDTEEFYERLNKTRQTGIEAGEELVKQVTESEKGLPPGFETKVDEAVQMLEPFYDETTRLIAQMEADTTSESQRAVAGALIKNRDRIQQLQLKMLTRPADMSAKTIKEFRDELQKGLDLIAKQAEEFNLPAEEVQKRINNFLQTEIGDGWGTFWDLIKSEGTEGIEEAMGSITQAYLNQRRNLIAQQELAIAQMQKLKKEGEATADDIVELQLQQQKQLVENDIEAVEARIELLGNAVSSPEYQALLRQLAELQTSLLDIEVREAEQKIDAALKRLQRRISIELSRLEVEDKQLEIVQTALEQELTVQKNINTILKEREKLATVRLKRVAEVLESETARARVQRNIQQIEQRQSQSQIEFQIKQEQFNREQINLQFLQIDLEEQRARIRAESQVAEARAELAKTQARKDATEEEIAAAQASVRIAEMEQGSLDETFRLRREILQQAKELSIETEKNLNTQLELAKNDGVLDKILAKYDMINAKIKDMESQVNVANALIDVNKELVDFAKEMGVREASSMDTRKWLQQNAERQLDLLKLQRQMQERMLEIEQRKEKAALRMQEIEVRNNMILAKREMMLARIRGDYEGMKTAQELINDLTEMQGMIQEEAGRMDERQAMEREVARRRGFLEYGKQVQELLPELSPTRQREERRALREESRREQVMARRNMEKLLKESGMFNRKERKDFIKELNQGQIDATNTEMQEMAKMLGIEIAPLIDKSAVTGENFDSWLNRSEQQYQDNSKRMEEVLAQGLDSPEAMMEVTKLMNDNWKTSNDIILDRWDQTLNRLEVVMGVEPGSPRGKTEKTETGENRDDGRIRAGEMVAEELNKSAEKQAEALGKMTEHIDSYDMFGITGGGTGITESETGQQFKKLLDAYKTGEISAEEFRTKSLSLREEAIAEAKKLDPLFTQFGQNLELNAQVIAANADQRLAAANLQTAEAIDKALGGQFMPLVEKSKETKIEIQRLREQQAAEERRKRELAKTQEQEKQKQHQEAQQERKKVVAETKKVAPEVSFGYQKVSEKELKEIQAAQAQSTKNLISRVDSVAQDFGDDFSEPLQQSVKDFAKEVAAGDTSGRLAVLGEIENEIDRLKQEKETGKLKGYSEFELGILEDNINALRSLGQDVQALAMSQEQLAEVERTGEKQRGFELRGVSVFDPNKPRDEQIYWGEGQLIPAGQAEAFLEEERRGVETVNLEQETAKLGQNQEQYKQAVQEQTRVQESSSKEQAKEQEKTNKTLVKVAKLLQQQGKHMVNNFEVSITAAPSDTPEKTANDTWEALVDIFNEVGRRSNFNNANVGTA